MNLPELLEEIHQQEGVNARAHELYAELREYSSTLLPEYRRFYNERFGSEKSRPRWHLTWVYRLLPWQDQLSGFRDALCVASYARDPFQQALMAEPDWVLTNLGDQEGLHRELMATVSFGWRYFVNTCQPSEEDKGKTLLGIIASLEQLFGNQGGARDDH
jgi:hypothetical protein